MQIQNNPINFTSRILPSAPLKETFWYSKSSSIFFRRHFTNMIDAIVNNGKADIIEIKRTKISSDENLIHAFINGEDAKIGCRYKNNNKLSYSCANAVYAVIERIQKRQAPIDKVKKFGFKKLNELYDKIFSV